VRPNGQRAPRAAGLCRWRAHGRQPPAQEPAPLKVLARAQRQSCYRVYDADLPSTPPPSTCTRKRRRGAPLPARAGIRRARSIPEADARRRFGELLAALHEVFALPRERIVVKTRERGKGGSKYGRTGEQGEFFAVREGAASCG
jgi:23S rRNA (guanine2445-N2)-methyltransferase / 23S rRNA (guanine2069-N7)-methyltransferase